MGLIRRVCVEEAVGTELTEKLTENLRETLCDNKVSVTSVSCVMPGLRTMSQITRSLKRSAALSLNTQTFADDHQALVTDSADLVIECFRNLNQLALPLCQIGTYKKGL